MDLQKQDRAIFSHFIGVDVGKMRLAIHDSNTGKTRFVDNTKTAIHTFFKACKPTAETMVVCEASGGYEALLLHCVTDLGVAAHRASASRIKSFIASYGTLAKTDLGDARAIAFYAEERHRRLQPWTVRDQDQQQLQALVLRRDDLVAMRVAEKNRSKAPQLTEPAGRAVKRSCKTLIATLDRQIGHIEKAIDKLVSQSDTIRTKYEILTAMPGIGPISARAIIAHMPEIGTCTRRKAASLAGLAPHPKDSGAKTGYRPVRGGRQPLKKALFMPAMVAAQGNSNLSDYYQSLLKNRKKPIVAITAVMRKIIVIANAKIRDNLYQSQQS